MPNHYPRRAGLDEVDTLSPHYPTLARAVADLLGLAAACASVVEHAGVAGVGADVLRGCRVAVVAVDARDLAAVSCRRALDVNVPLALGLAL